MTFLLPCPNCGPREAEEFSYGGETTSRPPPDGTAQELARYVYFRRNVNGWQTEWWYHRDGCAKWFLAERHTLTNDVRASSWFVPGPDSAASRVAGDGA